MPQMMSQSQTMQTMQTMTCVWGALQCALTPTQRPTHRHKCKLFTFTFTKGTAAPLRFLQASRWGRAFPVVSVVAVLLFPRFYPYMQS